MSQGRFENFTLDKQSGLADNVSGNFAFAALSPKFCLQDGCLFPFADAGLPTCRAGIVILEVPMVTRKPTPLSAADQRLIQIFQSLSKEDQERGIKILKGEEDD